jgi:hypothetical protein
MHNLHYPIRKHSQWENSFWLVDYWSSSYWLAGGQTLTINHHPIAFTFCCSLFAPQKITKYETGQLSTRIYHKELSTKNDHKESGSLSQYQFCPRIYDNYVRWIKTISLTRSFQYQITFWPGNFLQLVVKRSPYILENLHYFYQFFSIEWISTLVLRIYHCVLANTFYDAW